MVRAAVHTLTMSCWGIPSVMHTTSGISASMASMVAAAATGGGTNTTDAVAPVSALAYRCSRTQYTTQGASGQYACQALRRSRMAAQTRGVLHPPQRRMRIQAIQGALRPPSWGWCLRPSASRTRSLARCGRCPATTATGESSGFARTHAVAEGARSLEAPRAGARMRPQA
jgi:hypothetical protein